ncbi:MAG: preprotein translocase subunit SecA [Candidatus Pacebacteria bacterium]|nr:preprotein translocase subunit SecA [Candidatus Paceibacterota bacterium]
MKLIKMSILTKILGDSNERFLKSLRKEVEKINDLEKTFSELSIEALKNKTDEFKKRFASGEPLDSLLPEAFAAVREAAKRTLGQRHFDVQILGGMILHKGKIAEMKTGEGKTLVATLPAYLNALSGEGVHLVTVNDYLSRRDAAWMGQIYRALNLSVGCLNHESSFLYDPEHTQSGQNKINEENKLDKTRDTIGSFKVIHEFLRPCSRKEAYAADVVYGTNNEFGFDFLRDNLSYSGEQMVQRGYNYAVVDEVDSILIDEARTPLIISSPDEESADLYKTFAKIVPRLAAEQDFTIDEKKRAVSLTEEGIEKAEKLLGISDIYTEKGVKYVHHLNQALRANFLFKLDKDYVVKDGEVIIVDEFTGRLMPGRRWSEGLHQAVEAKENVAVQKESRTLASITFQNYFRMYKKLSGMTGTALTSAEEFHKVYNLDAVLIPTNKPMSRKDYSDFIFPTEKGKIMAVVREIKERHKKGQPVLVGTVSIEKNELLSAFLKKEGVPHRLLNAKHHEEEGEIIAQAGRKGNVTVATNMAGRGVDIVLGGNPVNRDEFEEVRNIGGLFVLGTERHEARRIDNQLRGRSGRQGDPGESRFFVSLEDDLMRVFGSEKMKGLMQRLGLPEDEAIENRMVSRAIESAQSKIEGANFDARKYLLEYDDVLNKQRTKIYSLRKKILFSESEELDDIAKKMFEKAGEDFGRTKEKENLFGGNEFARVKKNLLLRIIDMLWMDHLEIMDYMRSSVGLRAYGQRDPLVEYKNEGARMFKDLDAAIAGTFVKLLLNVEPTKGAVSMEAPKPVSGQPNFANVGRNDLCPCGSGKKYKRCHGA